MLPSRETVKEKLSHEGSILMHKRKVKPEKLIEAVRRYINGEGSEEKIAEEYGLKKTRLHYAVMQYKEKGPLAIIEQEHNSRYDPELKEKAVREYLDGQGSIRQIAAKYGLRASAILEQWIKVYNSGRGFRHKMSGGSRMKEARPTTVEERIQIARDCIANGENYGETALKFNVSYQQVYQWVKKYKEMGEAGLEDRRGKRKKDQIPRTELEKAQIEIERLKYELYMTKMERDLLKKLDEIERREAYRK